MAAISPCASRTARTPRHRRRGTAQKWGGSGCVTPIDLHCTRFDIRNASTGRIGRSQDRAAVSPCGTCRIRVCWGVSNGAPHLSIWTVRICAPSGAQFGPIHRFAQKSAKLSQRICACGPIVDGGSPCRQYPPGQSDDPSRRSAHRPRTDSPRPWADRVAGTSDVAREIPLVPRRRSMPSLTASGRRERSGSSWRRSRGCTRTR